jgi:hypothetical protein
MTSLKQPKVKKLEHYKEMVSPRLWPLQSQGLKNQACERTGLKEFGDPPVEPALSLLIESLAQDADLHPLGRFLIRSHVRELLETRLRLTEAWRQTDGFESAPVARPVFITGMPRSGSTFLHELLAADPYNRAPLVWEIMFPIPPPAPEQSSSDSRIRKASARLWWFRRLARRADSVHPLRACTPQECVAIHSYTFLSEEFLATCRIPKYEAFLHAADLKPAYIWQRRFVQYLQSRSPIRRWVFKSPDHVYGLKELFAVFPDAVVIQTHRNPLKVLRSSAQLIQVLHGVFAPRVDLGRIARREARVLAETIERATNFRDGHPELADRFVDLSYTELVSNPLAAVQRIYKRLDAPLSEDAAQRMTQLASRRSRYPKHFATPTLAQLGLDVSAEMRRFDPYCSRFGIGKQESVLHS